jgi:hypothetical protein
MSRAKQSPRIDEISWGKIRVDEQGEAKRYKDAKLWPGGSRGWDWGETGTHHDPGIQPADVEELVEQGATTVVLSRGMNRRLKVKEETISWLEERGVEAEVLETKAAVERYNELAETEEVGALIHSTC